MGVMSHLFNAKMMRLGLTSSGVEKARIDYDRDRDQVVLSVVVAGQVKHVRVPCQVTFSIEEIAAWMAGEDPLVAESAGRSSTSVKKAGGAETPTSS